MRRIGLVSLIISGLVFSLAIMSCELIEGKPDANMVREVGQKTLDYMEYLYGQRHQEMADGGAGATVSVVATPPGRAEKVISMTLTTYEQSETGLKYSGTVSLTGWSGDGSNPYVELTGTGIYSYDGSAFSRTLTGKFHLDEGEDENTIDSIEYDIAVDGQNYVTGTIKADGAVFTYSGERL